MATAPESVSKEQYLLKSTFFYDKLLRDGYFGLFAKVKGLSDIEGGSLCWDGRSEWNIGKEAWEAIEKSGIPPMMVFAHPKILQLNPCFLKYYRSVAMVPQKGLRVLSHVSNVDGIEAGRIEGGKLPKATVVRLVCALNEVMSLVVQLSAKIDARQIEGMMYATAGTNVDGSWRNQIGAEGERVIRRIIHDGLLSHNEISSYTDKGNETLKFGTERAEQIKSDIDSIKGINLKNGCSLCFASEPDVTIYDAGGSVLGVIEIKSGLDPAGALERLGAMFKSFENTLAEYPKAVTVLVISCLTGEVEKRLNASMVVRQRYLTTDITSSESGKRKFVNRLRAIMKLTDG